MLLMIPGLDAQQMKGVVTHSLPITWLVWATLATPVQVGWMAGPDEGCCDALPSHHLPRVGSARHAGAGGVDGGAWAEDGVQGLRGPVCVCAALAMPVQVG